MKSNLYEGEKEEHIRGVKIEDYYHLSSKKYIF